MQRWEYGYLYRVSARMQTGNIYTSKERQYVVVADAQGNRIIKNAANQLAALNLLGGLGWIISDDRNLTYNGANAGWLFDLIKSEWPEITQVQINASYFMRKPQS